MSKEEVTEIHVQSVPLYMSEKMKNVYLKMDYQTRIDVSTYLSSCFQEIMLKLAEHGYISLEVLLQDE